ncbi:MAG: hypothetical protein ACTHU0_17040, partial [Kofleriaceae bacterium]
MTQYASIFGAIMRSKPMSRYAPRLPLGTHRIVLKNYRTKQSDQNMGTILESDWMVSGSSNSELSEGDTRGWPWFIDGGGYAGTYAQTNAKECIAAVMGSVNLDELPRDAQGYIVNPVTGQYFFELTQHGMLVIDPATGKAVPKKSHDESSIGELCAFGYFRGVQGVAEVTPS